MIKTNERNQGSLWQQETLKRNPLRLQQIDLRVIESLSVKAEIFEKHLLLQHSFLYSNAYTEY